MKSDYSWTGLVVQVATKAPGMTWSRLEIRENSELHIIIIIIISYRFPQKTECIFFSFFLLMWLDNVQDRDSAELKLENCGLVLYNMHTKWGRQRSQLYQKKRAIKREFMEGRRRRCCFISSSSIWNLRLVPVVNIKWLRQTHESAEGGSVEGHWGKHNHWPDTQSDKNKDKDRTI